MASRSPQRSLAMNLSMKERREVTHDLAILYGYAMSTEDVGKAIGVKEDAARRWLKDREITPVDVNGKSKYMACDIAREMVLSKFMATA